MKIEKILLVFVLLLSIRLCGQSPSIQWQKCLGGPGDDEAFAIQQTKDNGFIIVGVSDSSGGDVTGNHGGMDMWIVKLDQGGNIQWQKSVGGSQNDNGYHIEETTDGGYIACGNSLSNDGDVSGHHGPVTCPDYFVVKLDSTGNIKWTKSFGSTQIDNAFVIHQTKDKGYILGGHVTLNNGDVTIFYGANDYWIVKLDSLGSIQWEKTYGGTSSELFRDICATVDGGYVVLGHSNSNDIDVTGHHGTSQYDYWIVKIDSIGTIQWEKSLGGSNFDDAANVVQTYDKGFMVCGFTTSTDGDVNGLHSIYSDSWLVKLDSLGSIKWQKCLGGSYHDYADCILQTPSKGYIFCGTTFSNDGDVSGLHSSGYLDFWLVDLDSTGTINWQICLGGTNNDFTNNPSSHHGTSMVNTADGSYILAGATQSNDGDVSSNHGGNADYWIVKLKPTFTTNTVEQNNKEFFTFYPNPTSDQIFIETSMADKLTVDLYDVNGQHVLSTNVMDKTNINLTGLNEGVYSVVVKAVDRVINKKLIILR